MQNMPTLPAFKKTNKMGRPPTLNEELIGNIVNAMRAGSYVETAAAVNGVSKEILFIWFRRGNKTPKTIYGNLVRAVHKAFAESELRDLLIIEKAARGTTTAISVKDETGEQLYDKDGIKIIIKPQEPNWHASAWRLERKFPKRWGRLDRLETSGPDGGAIEITEEDAEVRRARIADKIKKLAQLDEI
jgi:transposase